MDRDEHRQLSREVVTYRVGKHTFTIELDRSATVTIVGGRREHKKKFPRPVLMPFVASIGKIG